MLVLLDVVDLVVVVVVAVVVVDVVAVATATKNWEKAKETLQTKSGTWGELETPHGGFSV